MAIDTETKRRSVLGMGIMALAIAPLADGTIANVDREHIVGIYAGIAPAAPTATTLLNYIGATGKVVADFPPNHVSDSGDNLCILGDLEVQGEGFFSRVNVSGPIGTRIQTITIDTTLDNTHSTLIAATSGSVITLTLPTAASAYDSMSGVGRIYNITAHYNNVNNVIVDGDGAELINDGADVTLVSSEILTIQSNGTQWFIVY